MYQKLVIKEVDVHARACVGRVASRTKITAEKTVDARKLAE